MQRLTPTRISRLVASIAACLALAACDVEDFGEDGGLVDPEPAAPVEPEPPVAAPAYAWLVVEDASDDMNTAGAPGADICGVEFHCPDGRSGFGVEAILDPGAGEHCQAGGSVNGEPCYADRDDPQAALGAPQLPCEADSAPSHYVALGLGGRLAVRVDTRAADLGATGLLGCDVVVHERPGREREGYRVSVCADADGAGCLAPRPLGQTAQGDLVSVQVPALEATDDE